MVFCFVQNIFFRTTQELEYYFFCRAKCEFFFQILALDYMTKTLNQLFFFPPPKSEYFFQQHWESEYFFLEKKHNPSFKLNGRSLNNPLVSSKFSYLYIFWYKLRSLVLVRLPKVLLNEFFQILENISFP